MRLKGWDEDDNEDGNNDEEGDGMMIKKRME